MPNLSFVSPRRRNEIVEAARLRGLACEAREKRAELARDMSNAVNALRSLLWDGVSKTALDDAICGLRDAITNADHDWCRVIDECGESFDALDFSDLDALLAEVRR